jgi:hypothetical protein
MEEDAVIPLLGGFGGGSKPAKIDDFGSSTLPRLVALPFPGPSKKNNKREWHWSCSMFLA